MKKKLVCALLLITLLALPLTGCKELTVSITEPKHESTVTESIVEVRGFVSDAKATVWVNDVQVASVSKKGYYSAEVTLTEGENTIKVVAAQGKPGKWKKVIGREVTVTYSP